MSAPDPDADGDGLIGMFMHGLISRLCALDRLLAGAAINFLPAFQCGGETFAASPTFSPATSAVATIKARASSARVPMSSLMACVCLFIFFVFSVYLCFSMANFRRRQDELFPAACHLQNRVLPPNGLGTVSRASGSGIHWPSTTRQYS